MLELREHERLLVGRGEWLVPPNGLREVAVMGGRNAALSRYAESMVIDLSGNVHQECGDLNESRLVCADAVDFLLGIDDDSADVVFLDPPFNLRKTYGARPAADDAASNIQYRSFITQVIHQSARILKPGGALFLYHIPSWAKVFSAELDTVLSFRHWIAISMKNGFVAKNSLYPAHYALLYYTKGAPKAFNRPKLPLERCRRCGHLLKDYGGYRKFVESGVNLSDVWTDISPVRHSRTKNRAANELPMEIPLRALQISGLAGGLLVDPFVGAGTAIVAASRRGMRYLGCDREATYVALTRERVAQQEAQHDSESN